MLNKKKIRKVVAAMGVSIFTLGSSQLVANASDITSGTWLLYRNAPGSGSTGDTVVLTAREGKTYTAKCNTYSGSITVSFSNPYLSATNSTFSSTGTRRFSFANSVTGSKQQVSFKISDSHTGSASGSAYRN